MAFEESYKSLLQGVSQQRPEDRLDGQNTEQTNMLSDLVKGLRRRPGMRYAADFTMANVQHDKLAGWGIGIGSLECQVFVNTVTGEARILKYDTATDTYPSVLNFTNSYLTASSPNSLYAVSVNTELFLVNKEKIMGKGPVGGPNSPRSSGFFSVLAGAFNRKYSVTVIAKSGAGFTANYTTPDGTHPGDADLATPYYILTTLATQIGAATGMSLSVGYTDVAAFVVDNAGGAGQLRVETSSGKAFITVSGAGYLSDAQALPASLTVDAGGYTIATGSAAAPVYYKYDYLSVSWQEAAEYDTSFSVLTNFPVSVRQGLPTESELVLNTTAFEGRLAGDELSNPTPRFVGEPLTGAGSYQGRLVLMVGNTVYMSASGKPRRFFRSTVTALLDSDTIGVSASAGSSASWQQAMEYGKDLLLFSGSYQGVVPGSAAAVTPRNAVVNVNSKYDGDVMSGPVNIGRTVLFQVPSNDSYFGLMEVQESQYADSKYTAYDGTVHLPKYMAGKCRLGVGSSAARLAVFLSSTDRSTATVHEFKWQGDQKVQQAWHKWTFAKPVASAFFVGSRVHFVFAQNGYVVLLRGDPRKAPEITDSTYYAPLDMSQSVSTVGGRVAIPAWLYVGMADLMDSMVACTANGSLASEPLMIVRDNGEYQTPGAADGQLCIGLPFVSRMEFTPPMLKDHNGVVITTNKETVTRFIVGTNASREFEVSVSDEHPSVEQVNGDDPYTVSPIYFSSVELEIDEARVGGTAGIVVPARTNALRTRLIVSSDGTGEMNITSLEYVMRYKERVQRKKG